MKKVEFSITLALRNFLQTNFSENHMQALVDRIKNKDADMDLVVFLGSNHSKLIKMLSNKTNLFKLPYTAIMTKSEMRNVELRLDTNVVAVDEFRD